MGGRHSSHAGNLSRSAYAFCSTCPSTLGYPCKLPHTRILLHTRHSRYYMMSAGRVGSTVVIFNNTCPQPARQLKADFPGEHLVTTGPRM